MAVTPPQTDSGREDVEASGGTMTDKGTRTPARTKGLSAHSPNRTHYAPIVR